MDDIDPESFSNFRGLYFLTQFNLAEHDMSEEA